MLPSLPSRIEDVEGVDEENSLVKLCSYRIIDHNGAALQNHVGSKTTAQTK